MELLQLVATVNNREFNAIHITCLGIAYTKSEICGIR